MITSEPDLSQALVEWRRLLGDAAVLVGDEVLKRYGPGTSPSQRDVPAVLLPGCEEEVIGLVKVAQRRRVPIYPVSRGNNWGYGDAQPAVDGCAIVELSRMDRILEVDEELGLATIEPGVTYAQLHAYLTERDLPWVAPITGIGQISSIIGNALERGYGGNLHDHFQAVTSLQAVLPSGEVYRTPMTELGASQVDRAFKWGMGPYLDGIFSQGGFGVVTQATIALASKATYYEYFVFQFDDPALEKVVSGLQQARNATFGVIGEYGISNSLKELAKRIPYPSDLVPGGETISNELLSELVKAHELWDWTGFVAIQGTPEIAAAARKVLEQCVIPHLGHYDFITKADETPTRERAKQLNKLLPAANTLAIAYFRPGAPSPSLGSPAQDGCGMHWYSAIVPLKAAMVRALVESVERICRQHGMDPLITLVSVGGKALYMPLPLLFDRFAPEDAERARACYLALLEEGKQIGALPYRTSYHFMDRFVDGATPYWRLVQTLSEAMDPAGILAPGRYRPR